MLLNFMKKQIILLFIFLSSILQAEEKNNKSSDNEQVQETKENYQIMGDLDFSPFSGAQNILTVHESLEKSFGYIFKNKPEKNAIYSLLRIVELGFIWGPLARAEMVVQHEVFGHGYRVRDIGSDRAKVFGYKIDMPPPYGDGGGVTKYRFNSNLTSFQEIAISAGGVESTAILASRLKMKWMESLRLDPKKASLYLQSHLDLLNYGYSLKDNFLFADTGHDIESYIFWLNNTYYDDELKISDLKRAVAVNFLDPMMYYAIGAYFYYIFTGSDIKIPMITIKNVKFLPNVRLGLAPYGIEYFIENFLSYKNRAIYSYLRVGNHNNNTYFGVGLEYPRLCEFNLNTIGFRADLYHQPKIYSKEAMTIFEGLQVGYTKEELDEMIYGAAFSIIYDRKFSKKSDMSIFTEIGYKTDGFLPGFSVEKGVVFRLGIGLGSF
ncbi:MAG: hypothetical protein K1060chlam1_01215 [Candidatus Anoxychlamydiales bacterium]|nr:hypothetical protein [Candidatus Anoxychlamydiales bacterium]